MKNVVLIGASGFVGSAILNEALNRGHRVTAVVLNPGKISVRHPNLTVVGADATDPDTLANLAKGRDAVISAYNPGWANPRQYEETLENYPKIVEGAKRSGVKRLLIVGGAGTLFVKPGVRLVDTGTLPEAWLPGVKSLGEFYLNTLMKEQEIDWVFFSPAGNLGNMGPGVRTGKYRLGKDDMLFDEKGESFISVEDYAVAMIDESMGEVSDSPQRKSIWLSWMPNTDAKSSSTMSRRATLSRGRKSETLQNSRQAPSMR